MKTGRRRGGFFLEGCRIVSKKLWVVIVALAISLLPTVAGAQAALSLADCVQLALAKNHALQAQRLDLAAKESLAQGAVGLAGPKLTFGASYQWQKEPTGIIPAHGLTSPPVYDDRGKVWGFNLLQNVYDAGKTGALIRLSEDTAQLQSYETSAQELNLAGNVVKFFYRILQLNDNIKAQQDAVNALEALANEIHDKLKLGRVAEVDGLQVEAQLLAEKEKLVRYQNDRDRQVSLLKAAMGVEQLRDIELAGSLSDYDFNAPIVADVSRSPEVQKAAARKAQSVDLLKSSEADSAIQLSLNGRYNVTAVSRPGTPKDEMWVVVVQANLSVFDGGVIAANIRQAKLQVGKSRESYAQTVSDAEANAYSARLSADSAAVRVDAGKASLDRAREAYRIVDLSYRVGKASVTDLLFAQATLTAAQAAYFQAIFDRISAVVDLKIAYGQKVY